MRNTPSRAHTPASYSLCFRDSLVPMEGTVWHLPRSRLRCSSHPALTRVIPLSACHPLRLRAVGPWGKARGCSPAASPGPGGPACWDCGGDRAVPLHHLGDTGRAELARGSPGRAGEGEGTETAERWRRARRQSICDVQQFLMRPVACPDLRGCSRSRCLEKLSTAHCSKTSVTSPPRRRAGGTGRAGAGWPQQPASLQPPHITHPRDGHPRVGGKSPRWLRTGALPVAPRYPRGCCPLCHG